MRGTTWLVTTASNVSHVLSEKVAGYAQNERHIVLMRQVEQQAKFFLRVSKRVKMACAIRSENCNCVNVALTYYADNPASQH
jgi:hypothetical protein